MSARINDIDIDAVIDGYIACALWSTSATDLEGNHTGSLDDRYNANDIAETTRTEIAEDCRAFIQNNAEDLRGLDPYQIGHDFWLTRNRHGAGFWDRGLGDRGQRLTDEARAYGSVDLYIGDDHQIHA